jgi:hypothetical protein
LPGNTSSTGVGSDLREFETFIGKVSKRRSLRVFDRKSILNVGMLLREFATLNGNVAS